MAMISVMFMISAMTVMSEWWSVMVLLVISMTLVVSDIKSQGQPACREDQKKCKEESVNVMHECDVERMYAVYHVL